MSVPILKTVAKDHGRLDIREYWITSSLNWLAEKKDCQNLTAIGMARLTSTVVEHTSIDNRYFLISKQLNAQSLWNCCARPLGNRE